MTGYVEGYGTYETRLRATRFYLRVGVKRSVLRVPACCTCVHRVMELHPEYLDGRVVSFSGCKTCEHGGAEFQVVD